MLWLEENRKKLKSEVAVQKGASSTLLQRRDEEKRRENL